MELPQRRPDRHSTAARHHKSIRDAAAVLCAIVGVLYLILLFLVSDAEAVPGATDGNTYGAYLLLAIPYLVGTVLLVAFDRRPLYVTGAALQLFVIALFVVFGIGVYGPGVFEYDAVSHLRIGLWAAGITIAEVILFGLLCYLALTPPRFDVGSDAATTAGVHRLLPDDRKKR